MDKLVLLCSLTGHEDRVWHVSWSHDGKYLASCGGDKTIRIWGQDDDTNSPWKCIAVLEDAQSRTIRSCEWSHCGKYLASVSFDATTVIWEKRLDDFEMIASLEGHESEVKSVSWSISGEYLATCSRDKSVWIWEANSNTDFECISVLHGHSQDVKYVKWHPEEDILFSCSYDDTIKVWEEEEDDWYCKETLSGHSSTVWGLATNATGNRLVSCSSDKSLIVWEKLDQVNDYYTDGSPRRWSRVSTLSGYHSRSIFSVDWSHQSDLIVSGGEDDSICIFKGSRIERDISYELIFSEKSAHQGDINCVRWNPCKKYENLMASTGDDNIVRIWSFHSASLQ